MLIAVFYKGQQIINRQVLEETSAFFRTEELRKAEVSSGETLTCPLNTNSRFISTGNTELIND